MDREKVIRSAKELDVYEKAYNPAMDIFQNPGR
jgi:hypothetical protein